MNNQAVAGALQRIHAKIDGKSRENSKVYIRPMTPTELDGRAIDDDSTHVESAEGDGVLMYRVSMAEVETRDVLTLGNSLPPSTVNADARLKAFIRGSMGAKKMNKEFVALAVADLDYLTTTVEAAQKTPSAPGVVKSGMTMPVPTPEKSS